MREKGDLKKVEWGLPGIRGEDHGSYFLMGTEFQLYKRKRVLEMNVVMVAQCECILCH